MDWFERHKHTQNLNAIKTSGSCAKLKYQIQQMLSCGLFWIFDNRKMCTSRKISATKPLHHISYLYKFLLRRAWLKFWLNFCASYSFDCCGKIYLLSIFQLLYTKKIIWHVAYKSYCLQFWLLCTKNNIISIVVHKEGFWILMMCTKRIISNIVWKNYCLQFWLMCTKK